MNEFSILDTKIGNKYPPYIIAELSGNHNGDLNRALKLVEEAHKAGANAIKLQTYTADTITINHKSSDFKISSGLWQGKYLYDLYKEAHTPWEWHKKIFKRAQELGLDYFSSPFDNTSVDFLEKLNVPAYKVASFELLDLGLVEYIARQNKPLIISTGMASKIEIEDALKVCKKVNNYNIILLHCVSGYPTPLEEINLRMILELEKEFKLPVGLSDHTIGTSVPITAIGLGACVIEKHFTLARKDGGPDSAFSLEPREFSKLTSDCRNAWQSLGNGNFERSNSEKDNIKLRRSLYAIKDISKGDVFTNENIKSIRPGYGLKPKLYNIIIGKKSLTSIKKGTALKLEYIENFSNEN